METTHFEYDGSQALHAQDGFICRERIRVGERVTEHQCNAAIHAQCASRAVYSDEVFRCACGGEITRDHTEQLHNPPSDAELAAHDENWRALLEVEHARTVRSRSEVLSDMENLWRERIRRLWMNMDLDRKYALEHRRAYRFNYMFDGLTVDTSPSTPASEMIFISARIVMPDNEHPLRQIKRLFFWIKGSAPFTVLTQKAMYIAHGGEWNRPDWGLPDLLEYGGRLLSVWVTPQDVSNPPPLLLLSSRKKKPPRKLMIRRSALSMVALSRYT